MLILAFFSSTILMSIGLWGFIMSLNSASLLPVFGGLAFFLLALFALVKKEHREKIMHLLMLTNIVVFSVILIGLFKTLPLINDALSENPKIQYLMMAQISVLLWSFIYFLIGAQSLIKKRKKANI